MTADFYKEFFDYVGIFFLIYLIGYASFLFFAVATGSAELYRDRQKYILKNELFQDYFVPVSVIIPAYNEEVTIVSSVRSLLCLDYSLYEIIIVDDGSKDGTSDRVIEAFDLVPVSRPVRKRVPCRSEEGIYEGKAGGVPIVLVRKTNGGKADALNMGINLSSYPYFICMDADSMLQKDSLKRIVMPVIEEDNVVAVGGTVRPANGIEMTDGEVKDYRLPEALIPCMQVLEYDRSFLAARILFDKFNGSVIISGAFGLFKKELVVDAGGYDVTTMGEDMELVVKLHVFCREHDIPYRIKYAQDAVCWSQVPETLADLRKQRRRWHIGLFQSMTKHRNIFLNRKYGAVGYISYIYFLLYELLSPYIEVFGILTVILAYFVNLINVPFMILFFAIYVVYTSVLTITAFMARIHVIDLKISLGDVMKAVMLCGVEVGVLRFILAWVRATALIGYRAGRHKWGEIKRKAM